MALRVSAKQAAALIGGRPATRAPRGPRKPVVSQRSRPLADANGVYFTVPMPPSVNALTKNRRGGRSKTEAYKAWIAEAGTVINTQRVPCIRFGADLHLVIHFGPRIPGADLSNRIKAVEDLAVRMGIIRDDRDVVDMRICWDNSLKGAAVWLTAAS